MMSFSVLWLPLGRHRLELVDSTEVGPMSARTWPDFDHIEPMQADRGRCLRMSANFAVSTEFGDLVRLARIGPICLPNSAKVARV